MAGVMSLKQVKEPQVSSATKEETKAEAKQKRREKKPQEEANYNFEAGFDAGFDRLGTFSNDPKPDS